MKKLLFLLFFFFQLLSCSTIERGMLYNTAKYDDMRYSHFYVIDTIQIDSPMVLKNKSLYYIFPKTIYKANKINKDFFQRKDVFLYDGTIGDISMYVDKQNDFYKYDFFNNLDCNLVKTDIIKNGNFYEFKKLPKCFVLCFVNVNYFNWCNRGFICSDRKGDKMRNPFIKDKMSKINYRKIVFPICQSQVKEL